MNEFTKRTVTGLILAAVFYCLIRFLPDEVFSLLVFVIASGAALELAKLVKPTVHSPVLMFLNGLLIGLAFTFGTPAPDLAFMLVVFITGLFFLIAVNKTEKLDTFVRDIGFQFLVAFYLYFPLYYMFKLKELHYHYLFFLIFVIAIGDSFAYFIGRWIGKTKIYKIASPKKSLQGLIAAIITAAGSGVGAIYLFPVDVQWWIAAITGGVIGLFSQLSDPIESLFKRAAKQKDSSDLIPGHGGILDRVDSYIFCAPALFYAIQYLW